MDKKLFWPFALIGASAISACQVGGASPRATPASVSDLREVVFAPQVIDRGSFCMIGFAVTYPKDIAPHSRHIRITTLWSETSHDNPWPIPSLGPPDSFTDNEDGTVTFTGAIQDSVAECDPELTGRTLAIGPCAEGACAPARFEADEHAARFGLAEAQY